MQTKLLCQCCNTHKFWAAKKVINLVLCTDCLGEIARQAADLGVMAVRERLDRENKMVSPLREQSIIANNGANGAS